MSISERLTEHTVRLQPFNCYNPLKFNKIVLDHIPRTTRAIEPLRTSPVNQRTNLEQAQDPSTAKPQTSQPETKRRALTGAQFITVHRQAILQLFVESGTRKLRSWNPGQNFSLMLIG